MSKEVFYHEDARQRMKMGVDKVANVVKVTLGPRGRNVVIKKSWGPPDVTKDGVTVAKELTLADPCEDVGAQLCVQAATRANDAVGDGTTTATVLTQALIAEGMKYVSTGANAIAVKRGIDKASKVVLEYIDSQNKILSIDSPQEVESVATISGNDPTIGSLVAKAFVAVGTNGIVTHEVVKNAIESSVKVIEGYRFDCGFVNEYFARSRDRTSCTLDNCLVLLWERRITNPHDLIPLMNSIVPTKKPLLIIADDVEGDALGMVLLNSINNTLPAVIVKAPGYGERRKSYMEDIAVLTGGTFFSEALGKDLKTVTVGDLGTAEKVIVTKDSTSITGGGGNKEKVTELVQSLKEQAQRAESTFDREKFTERVAKLSGAVAIISIGGTIDSELKEKQYRFEDAISATKRAIEIGIVPGGGTVLYKAREKVRKLKFTNVDEQFGAKIVEHALGVPINTILENSGFDMDQRNKILLAVSRGKGYDGVTGKIVQNMFQKGIVDPTSVVKSTIESATAVAGLFLTTEATIIEEPKEKTSQPMY